ncbi:Major capsid protein VP54 [Only Syngen Nebraska virus 5]|uniref:Major capsid protein VP54 n=1 Tax=Only Syngen Nebraska virus 5 TaxID=1917232 RepID=UPI0009008B64|nr:Major capsid protein VP54 [Only Syngen Nebraska virus 5]APC25732.1 Major capsid protein VP54 [Only Syngen Nebraska virus 5]
MAGGLSQLVAYGAQDVYLTGNPQITFFKTVYRRYTNFAIESIQQTINGSVGFGNKVSTQISRNGDLITDIVVEFVLTKTGNGGTTYYPAEELLQDVELEIGGQRIDKHYNDWFRTYDALFRMNDDRYNYRRMVDWVNNEVVGSQKRFYVPLIFFFNQTPGLALPLIALQYHEVKLYFTLASQVQGVNYNGSTPVANAAQPTMSVWVDYIFLDTQERTRFAQLPHEYLIEQLQFTGSETATPSATTQASQNIRLNFNHPTKYLAWNFNNPSVYGQYTALANIPGAGANGGTPTGSVTVPDWGNTGTYYEQLAVLDSAKIQLNGQDRFATRKGSYFNKVQPYQTIGGATPAGVYLYSFALKPAGRQPSGTCNFSRIDNATLSLTYKTCSIDATQGAAVLGNTETTTANTATLLTALNIYAKNYNVLRIMSGMGGLAYAN